MKIKPLGKRILVKPIKLGEITPGGIHLPQIMEDKPIQGEVVAVGDSQLGVGDKVMYGKHAGQEIEFEQEKFLILRDEDVMAVLQ